MHGAGTFGNTGAACSPAGEESLSGRNRSRVRTSSAVAPVTEDSLLGRDVFDQVYGSMAELLQYCPGGISSGGGG